MTYRVLVTRPIDQAQGWVERLCAEGFAAEALPLIGIAPLADTRPVVEAWRGSGERAALMFVSASAVAQFFAARPAGTPWPRGLLAAVPGPGTATALRSAGVPSAAIVEPAVDATQFDSERLWAMLATRAPWQGRSVLIVRGTSEGVGDDAGKGHGREWLAERWREAGAQVDSLAVYRRGAPSFDAAQAQRWQAALDAPDQHVWLFGSSEAIEHGEALASAQQRSDDWRRITAVTTHPRIAKRARACGLAQVLESAPTLAGIVQSLRSLIASGSPRAHR